MDYKRLVSLHDRLLLLEQTVDLLSESEKCGMQEKGAFLLLMENIREIRMELFAVIGEAGYEEPSKEQ